MSLKQVAKLRNSKLTKYMLILVTALNVYFFYFRHTFPHGFNKLNLFGDDLKIDWEDHEFSAYEAKRVGPGEQGAPIKLTDPIEIEKNEEGYKIEGIYTVVNDKISPQRSLPDIRLDVCKTRKYLSNLPTTSVVVIFFNENWNLLLRCLHSIYNRTPHKLLHEIILISDKSTDDRLGKPLARYVKENFGDIVKFFINDERKGLIVTRMEGARKATGEVIVFLDSHMEVNVNWLPPLLEPIALNSHTACVPIIDSFSPYTLEYQTLGQGSRGSFDWTMTYQWLPLTKKYQKNVGDVYQLSAMTGGAYAINRNFFFKLGGYDEGLMVWNGENYELSFKLHLCGGNLVQVPCSRVAHTTKHRTEYREQNYGVDFSSRNLKRVAEVWMDEYKVALYRSEPDKYVNLDAGDLSKAFEIKKQLKCKPFKYYMEEIAPDLAERYPPFEKPHFASGAIYSERNPGRCVTYVGPTPASRLKLTDCSQNLTRPAETQYFEFTWHRFIKYGQKNPQCIDTVAVNMYYCHFNFGHQFWRYDLKTHQIINPPTNTCISSDINDENLFMSPCNEFDFFQKFNWGYVNVKALANWETEGIAIFTTVEGEDLSKSIEEELRGK